MHIHVRNLLRMYSHLSVALLVRSPRGASSLSQLNQVNDGVLVCNSVGRACAVL